MLQNLLIMLFSITPIFCLLCSFLCLLGMHYADKIYSYNCTFLHKMIMIGRKCNLKEQLQNKIHKNVSKLMSVHQFVAILIVT